MRTERWTGFLIGVAGFVVAFVVALQPMRFFTPGGPAKDEVLPAQVIDCGTAFHPKNAPANSFEECDGTHIRRGFLIASILAVSVLLGGLVAFGPGLLRRRRRSAVEDFGDR